LQTLPADVDRLNRTNQKMEIATDEPWNPIKQDTRKDGALR
jgi:hypothetical protein